MPPRRPKRRDDGGAAVRAHLLRLQTATLCTLIGVDWPGAGGGSLVERINRPETLPPLPELSDEQLSWPFGSDVRALRDGREYEFHRADLPDWSPLRARHCSELYSRMLLTVDDEVVELA